MYRKAFSNFSAGLSVVISPRTQIITLCIISLICFSCSGGERLTKKGAALIEQGNYEKALIVLSDAVHHNPADAEAHYQLGVAYGRLKRYDEAAKEFQYSLSLEPSKATVQYELGKVVWLLGRRSIALRRFRNILQTDATDEQIREIMELTGEIYPVTRLTRSRYDSGSPVFSPNSSQIAFVRTQKRMTKIIIMDDITMNEVMLTPPGFSDSSPQFSPDGTEIIFSSYSKKSLGHRIIGSSAIARDNDISAEDLTNTSIWVMDITGDNRCPLLENSSDALNPAYSPDGKTAVFQLQTSDGWEIHTADITGTNLERLTYNQHNDAGAKFSPDGRKLVFFSNRDGDYEIYLMNVDGSNQTRLTDNDSLDYMPNFSPDGTKITFVSDRNGNKEIYTMNINGTQQKRLTNSDGNDTTPAFSPDGQKIAFASVRDSSYMQICIMDISRHLTRAELLARINKQIARTWK